MGGRRAVFRRARVKYFERVEGGVSEAVSRGARVVIGEEADAQDRTIHAGVLVDARIVQEEIFGLIVPVLTYRFLDEATKHVDARANTGSVCFQPGSALHRPGSAAFVVGWRDCQRHHDVLRRNAVAIPAVNGSGIGRSKGIYGFGELSNARSIFAQKTG